MTKDDTGKVLSAEELRVLQGSLREKLLDELRSIDPSVVGELNLKLKTSANHFSDWHDKFNDGGNFSDGFGKAGGRVAEIKTALGPAVVKKA